MCVSRPAACRLFFPAVSGMCCLARASLVFAGPPDSRLFCHGSPLGFNREVNNTHGTGRRTMGEGCRSVPVFYQAHTHTKKKPAFVSRCDKGSRSVFLLDNTVRCNGIIHGGFEAQVFHQLLLLSHGSSL